jgi:hypothetical protein
MDPNIVATDRSPYETRFESVAPTSLDCIGSFHCHHVSGASGRVHLDHARESEVSYTMGVKHVFHLLVFLDLRVSGSNNFFVCPYLIVYRNAIFSMFNSLSECWQLLITDYGVMPSIIALFTLAALIFLLFIMLRSITPRRTRRAPPVQDKKKKKRKGQGRHRGISGKIKSAPSTRSRAAGASVPQTSREATSPVRSLGDNAPDLTPLTPSSSVHNAKSSGSSIKVEECNRELNDLPESYACPTPILPIASKTTFEKDLRRTRVPSVSTLDTTAMSDDLSCGSISIRSLPSVGVSTSTALSCPVPPEQKPFMLSATPSTTISEDHKLKAGVSNPRRNKRLGNTSAKTKMNPSKCIEGPSRWDALKPTPAVKHVHQQAERQKPSGKAVEKVSHIQHQPPSAPRVSNRRAGRGGGGPKKGRGGNHQHASTSGNRNSVSRSPTQPDRLATTQSPVSPPSIEHQDTSRFSFPAFDSLPPPPPGLGSTLLFTNDRLNEDSRLFPVQQNSFSGGRSLLPPSQGHPMPARSWDLAPEQPNAQEWHNPAPFESSPTRIGTSSRFHGSPAGSLGYGVVKENPFAPDTVTETTRGSDEQIEADLQELGGQMVGSILDF